MIIDVTRLSVSPFVVESIVEMKVEQSLNQHASMYLKGIIPKESGDSGVMDTDDSTVITVSDQDGVIFSGLVQDIRASFEGQVYYLEVWAVSFSIKADTDVISRSFQDAGMNYQQIGDLMAGENELSMSMEASPLSIHNLLLQYQETNWEFLKRIASHNHSVLLPSVEEPKFYFGIPKGNDKGSLLSYRFSVGKNIRRYRRHFGAGVDVSSEDSLEYIVHADDSVLAIGDMVDYGGTALFVREARIHLADAVLTCRYVLCPENGLKVPAVSNPHITGLTLAGQVLEVNQDTVKVLLCVDESQDSATAYAFPYMTPYSAENHTGLYLMPETGDVVNIQFPTEDESLAVALSSYRQADSDKTGDPNVKYLRTPHDKEIKISEDEILITAKTGGLYIKLNQDNGIEVFSQHGITVNTLSSIDMMAAGHISLSAGTNIILNAGLAGSLNAGKGISVMAGKDVSIMSGTETSVSSGKEMTFSAAKKLGMETKDEFVVNSEKNMTVASQKKLSFSSKEDMVQAADKKLKVSAKSEVGISCKSSSIKLDGAMNLKASQIKEN
ncbi:MAG: DUF2345 domain-containing protein [Lachnospiraceae bacterium]|jgi:hypothetical protein|nr:DUF2345 domain-containing protein [Lachnospiraceae bacterium]